MPPKPTPLRFLLTLLLTAPVACRVQLWPLEKTSPAADPADPSAPLVAAPAPVAAPVAAPVVAPEQERGALETSTASEPQPSAAPQLWEAVPGGAPPTPDGSAAFVNSYDKSMGNGGEPATLRSELSTMHLTLQSLAAYPNAVCNDGSPAGYYFSPAQNGDQDYIIYLEGGMWCWSAESCSARYSATVFEMSSKNWPATLNVGGMFSVTKVNPFSKAAKAYLSYCSSDAWLGDADASSATGGFVFRGQAIIEAAITDMVARFNLSSSSNVLFGGCSAGARGAMFNLDYIAPLLPPGAGLKGLLDSALWLDLTPPDGSEVSLQEQTQGVFAMVNPSARIPPACAAAYPGSEGWKCIYGVYRLPFVTTPYFINAAQFDSFQMLYDLGGDPPQTPPQVLFADQFQSATVAALQPAVGRLNGVFSSTCLVHCLSVPTANLYTEVLANGINIVTALGAWYFNGTAVDNISNCQGYPCVESCPGGTLITGISTAVQSQATLDANGGKLSPTSSEAANAAALSVTATAGAAETWMNLGR